MALTPSRVIRRGKAERFRCQAIKAGLQRKPEFLATALLSELQRAPLSNLQISPKPEVPRQLSSSFEPLRFKEAIGDHKTAPSFEC